VWSLRELQDIYARNGGTVTGRPVTRGCLSDGSTYDVTELVLAIDLGHLGTAVVVTDWDPADEVYGFALPIVQALAVRDDDERPASECTTCGAPADKTGASRPEHRVGSPCTVDYRAI
jgi:hypothetical protein